MESVASVRGAFAVAACAPSGRGVGRAAPARAARSVLLSGPKACALRHPPTASAAETWLAPHLSECRGSPIWLRELKKKCARAESVWLGREDRRTSG